MRTIICSGVETTIARAIESALEIAKGKFIVQFQVVDTYSVMSAYSTYVCILLVEDEANGIAELADLWKVSMSLS